jgi:hypothetical protein
MAILLAALAGTSLAGCSQDGSGSPLGGNTIGRKFTSENWGTLNAHPNAYRGAVVSFVGKVAVPFDARQTPPSLVVFTDPKGSTGVAVVAVNVDPGVKAGDYVSVEGRVLGEFTGSGPFLGSGVTRVLVQATSVVATAGPTAPSTGE